jgi:hypothetical protein
MLSRNISAVVFALLAPGLFGQTPPVSALPEDSGYTMRRGRNIQPFYEGWQKLPNGRTVMWFGYLNRNSEEETDVPVGPNNKFDLRADMGQPTHFYPRRRRFVFRVELPADWPEDRRLVWTVTANGRPDSANGWLQAEWEVDDGVIQMNLGLDTAPPDPPNFAPGISVKGDTAAVVGRVLTLAASATDDGLPKGRRPTNFQVTPQKATPLPIPVTVAPRAVRGLRIRWMLYRAPETGGSVTFDRGSTEPALGASAAELVTGATFSAPGTYWLRAVASDGMLETPYDLKVNVVK